MKDDLGDRMKALEKATRAIITDDVIVTRIDGKAFHSLTKGFDSPYDERIAHSMRQTARNLMDELPINAAYVQSDEISLVFHKPSPQSQMYFGGNVQKLSSVTASIASVLFYKTLSTFGLPKPMEQIKPYFDSRVFGVPSQSEAANCILWRIQDAQRNAVSAYGRQVLGHKAMQGLSTQEARTAMYEAGFDLLAQPEHALHGSMFIRKKERAELSEGIVAIRSKVVEQCPQEYRKFDMRNKINTIFGGDGSTIIDIESYC